jgi:hypothetical protein
MAIDYRFWQTRLSFQVILSEAKNLRLRIGDASRLRFFGRPSAEGLSQNDKMMSDYLLNGHQGGV